MARKILLIEPNYKNKYPPIGLMKLSTYHKMQGDKVEFFKGDLKQVSLTLKTNDCLKRLKKVDGRFNWDNKRSTIEAYLATKQVKFIELLIDESNPNRGEEIEAVLRYCSKHTPQNKWDRIYITTLFTFYWEITIKTIEFAKTLVNLDRIYVGGVMASLLKEEIYQSTGIMPFAGLLDTPGILDEGNPSIIDELPLDYSILEEIEYKYPTQSAYFTYMTKGCTRKCAFCSVPKLEPTYKDKIETINKFQLVNQQFGEQRNLLLMDNNVLASPKFGEIIAEIKEMGFTKNSFFTEPNQLDICIKNLKTGYNDKAYLTKSFGLIHDLRNRLQPEILADYDQIIRRHSLQAMPVTKESMLKAYKELKVIYEKHRLKTHLVRYVDFNQGTDARYVNDENMRLMSEIPIRPLRIAFDHIGIKNTYINAVELAAKYGIKDLSNYILYNFHDKPEDLYERLKINVDLGKRLGIKIFSFPMKYIPLFGEEAKHRRYIGTHWNRKFIRAVQSILNATKGIVAPGYDYFYMAFGETLQEFMSLLWMPEIYIINRVYFQNNGMAQQWKTDFEALNELELLQAKEFIQGNEFSNINALTQNPRLLRLLSHYVFLKEEKSVVSSEVRRLRNRYNKMIKRDMFLDLTLTHDFDSKKKNRIAC